MVAGPFDFRNRQPKDFRRPKRLNHPVELGWINYGVNQLHGLGPSTFTRHPRRPSPIARARVPPSVRMSAMAPDYHASITNPNGSVPIFRHLTLRFKRLGTCENLFPDIIPFQRMAGVRTKAGQPNSPTIVSQSAHFRVNMTQATAAEVQAPRFPSDDGFHKDLKLRVHAALADAGYSDFTGGVAMMLKSLVILGWFVASYVLLVFFASEWWHGVLLSVSLALSVAGIGFAIQHDANHGSYSKSRWLNKAMSWTLDILGGSSHVWSWKHNVFHHTYTNVKGADSDIDVGMVGRLSPSQRRRSLHRFQHIYLWFLYGMIGPKWQLIDDFQNVATGKIGGMKFPRGRARTIAGLVLGKLVFFGWAIVLPLFFHPVLTVVAYYLLASFVMGVALSVVFQLAHCVEEAEFPASDSDGRLRDSWAAHQVRTTVDFAQGHPIWTWFLGGLNYQIEHHLFPKISHLHYPRIAPVVRQVCAEYGVPYAAHRTFGGALASHYRWLKRMGQPA